MILLTGASGFIGQHLVQVLRERFPETSLVALSAAPIAGLKTVLHGGYRDGQRLEAELRALPLETVIHGGAFTPKNKAQASDWSACASNVSSVATLLSSLPKTVKRLVYLSTLDVYRSTDARLSERSVVEPVSLYAHSKHFGEELVRAWGKDRGVLVQVLRVGHIFGPGEEAYEKLIPATIRAALAGRAPQQWGDGADLRSFLFVTDAAQAIATAVTLESEVGVINLVGGEAVPVREVLAQIVSLVDPSLVIEHKPSSAPRRDLVFDDTKLRETLLPGKVVTFAEGLRREVDHVRGLR